jgi:outer membrane protein, multidrug efflux system
MGVRRRCAALVSITALLTACATRPPQVLTPKMVPKALAAPVAGTSADWPPLHWWRQFDSPELSRLVALAGRDNQDLAAAVARLKEAGAVVIIQRSALLPQINAQFQGVRTGVRAAALSTSVTGQRGATVNSFGLFANSTYELDVWGLARDNLRAAEESLDASRFARQAVALTTIAEVADTYFEVLALRERIAIANEDIDAVRGILDTVRLKVRAGTSSDLDLAEEEAQLQASQSELPVLKEQELEARVALAVLVGRPPEGFGIAGKTMRGIQLPEVTPGLPSELLARRPDVAEAEANLAAAHANLQAARAAFLPQFSLSGSAGFSSVALQALLHGPSFLWDAGGELVQSIFDGGKLLGEERLAYATQLELIADYQNTVLDAYSDVESALGQVRNDGFEEADLRSEVAAAREAFQISELQYREGTADLLNVLQAQQTLFGARDALAQVRLARMQAVVHLYEALGGGWQEPQSARTQFEICPGSKCRASRVRNPATR